MTSNNPSSPQQTTPPQPKNPRFSFPFLLLEFGSIVFAVLLALGADAWREETRIKRIVKHVNTSIHTEISDNLTKLEEVHKGTVQRRDILEETLKKHEKDGYLELSVEDFVAFKKIYPGQQFSGFLPENAAWQAAESATILKDMAFDQLRIYSRVYSTQEHYSERFSVEVRHASDFRFSEAEERFLALYEAVNEIYWAELNLRREYQKALGKTVSNP